MYVTTCCPRLVCQLNMLFQKKVSACRGKNRKGEDRGSSKGGMSEVPPASIYPKSNLSLSVRHMNTYAHTHTYSPLTPYNILNIGPPDGSSTWQKSKARAHQANQQNRSRLVWLVTLQVVIQPLASFYVAFLAAPILRSAISEGIIS